MSGGIIPIIERVQRVIFMPFFLSLWFFCGGGVLFALDDNASYRIEKGRFIQKLEWDASPNVYKYEAVIMQEGRVIEKKSLTENYLETSLPPGEYTYSVVVYNLLGLPEYTMGSVSFEIRHALQPFVKKWTPSYLDTKNENTITLEGENIMPDAEIYIVQNKKKIEPLEIKTGNNGTIAEVTFQAESLKSGSAVLYVINPGGLSNQKKGLKIQNGYRLNIEISLLYSPVYFLHFDEDQSEFMRFIGGGSLFSDLMLQNEVYSLGALFKTNYMFLNYKYISFGAAFEIQWADIKTKLEFAEFQSNLAGAGLGVVTKIKMFNNFLHLDLTVRGGATGLMQPVLVNSEGDTDMPVAAFAFLSLGSSIKLFPVYFLFIELGASWYITAPFDDSELRFVRPYVGVGMYF